MYKDSQLYFKPNYLEEPKEKHEKKKFYLVEIFLLSQLKNLLPYL